MSGQETSQSRRRSNGAFTAAFTALTGNAPFPWQQEMYDRMVLGRFKELRSCRLPTGLGKTAVIPIWLIALANAIVDDNGNLTVPRRLVYIVNRRTVVDQSTDEAEKLRKTLRRAAELPDADRNSRDADWDVIEAIRQSLARLCAADHDCPLAISTLRGQRADNAEWRIDPARPAVVVGTVDMIGSRLLFSGYGSGFKSRPLHAGFLGQDALIVHDEAHLEPAFQKLLEAIEKEQWAKKRSADAVAGGQELLEAIDKEQQQARTRDFRPVRIMELSATSRGQDGKTKAFELTDKEKSPPEEIPEPRDNEPPIHRVWRRLKATKQLHLKSAKDAARIADAIGGLALDRRWVHDENGNAKDADAAVLVFVRTLDDLQKVCNKLTNKKDGVPKRQVCTLTGTMRGRERDRMADPRRPDACRVFARFLNPPKPDAPESERWQIEPMPGTVFLVCTSAGEVGIDMSADHIVCDLSSFESMAQRLGRVNRFGNRKDTRVDVVHPEQFDTKDKLAPARQATLTLLQQLDGDASPLALGKMMGRLNDEERKAAFSPVPHIPPTSDILFDAWAMTTIRDRLPGRPAVAPYLHGIAEWEQPQTYVAWREEVELVTEDLRGRHPPEDLLEDYPLKPHELLRDRSDRVLDELQKLAKKHPDAVVWLMENQGRIIRLALAVVADPSATKSPERRPLIQRLAGCTVLLPPSVGGLSGGMLDGDSLHAEDVADIDAPEMERRIRVWSDTPEYDDLTAGMRLVRSVELSQDDDDEERPTWDWYQEKPSEGTRTAQRPVRWNVHVGDAVRWIDGILTGLAMPEEIAQALRVAVKLHDHGKRRSQFQCALGNRAYPALILAKGGRAGARLPETYRHEFGSLADAAEDAEFRQLSPEMQELALHLIAAHHGRARPHFRIDEAFDPAPGRTQADADRLACEVPRRFGRLQRKYGRWGLAYLESLLRAADWAASAEPSEFVARTEEVSR